MSHHQKRLASPKNWRIQRKTNKWIVKAAAGPHPHARSLPLGVAVRDYLDLVTTGREARRVIGAGEVMVDGRIVKKHKHPVGYFDVISVPKLDKHFRVLVDAKDRLTIDPISKDEAAFKLVRINDKTTIKGGLTQLNLHDGRNIVVVKDEYKTGDTLKIALPSQEIQGRFPLNKGALAFVIDGRHAGEVATIEDVLVSKGVGPNQVVLKRGDKTVRTVREFVFPVGAKKAEITFPEGVKA